MRPSTSASRRGWPTLCAKEHSDLVWIPRDEQGNNSMAAQAVCRRCMIKNECLATAIRG
jgi:hypothetical protein